ncbi:CMP deaminase [Rhizobium leguminosarum]|uniref:deoxycytidylate deaminase n=1 Tax=Rhizobium leguminosarum TaxID=384 RepID=UPI001C963C1B|nr:deaminase [Rhizobium leguminosarum]MBY5399915.1 CMP deaminase [Rhizobium leguminosarum]
MNQLDKEMMELALKESRRSPVASRKVGVVIADCSNEVVATACNELFGDVNLPPDMDVNEDDAKTYWVEHAERAAIYLAAKRGIRLAGCSIYSTLFPCSSCMRAIVQSGIGTLVAPPPDLSLQKWSTEFRHSKLIQENSPLTFRPYVPTEAWLSRALG